MTNIRPGFKPSTFRATAGPNEPFSANTKHLYNICTTLAQRLRRWSNIVKMLYKCFVFTGKGPATVLYIKGRVSQLT